MLFPPALCPTLIQYLALERILIPPLLESALAFSTGSSPMRAQTKLANLYAQPDGRARGSSLARIGAARGTAAPLGRCEVLVDK